MMNLPLLLILALTSPPTFALNLTRLAPPGPMSCEKATLITTEMRGEFSKKTEDTFCFDKTFAHITSKNCEKNCDLIARAKVDKAPLEYQNQGQPGSWICQSYGGKARVMFFEHRGVRHKQSFCLKGGDVVSTPYLLNLRTQALRGK